MLAFHSALYIAFLTTIAVLTLAIVTLFIPQALLTRSRVLRAANRVAMSVMLDFPADHSRHSLLRRLISPTTVITLIIILGVALKLTTPGVL